MNTETEQELKPTDTAKLLEWLEDLRVTEIRELETAIDKRQFGRALNHKAMINAIEIIDVTIENNLFTIDEAPEAKDPLQVLAEIWDKWVDQLVKSQIIGRKVTGETVIKFFTDQSINQYDRHGFAVYLALAVHMEIDGTVGSHKRTKRLDLAFDTRSGQLLLSVGSSTSPCYLRYSNMADAKRACELLQPIAKELFFVFEDDTPTQGEESL